jgi:hypothetical protein
MDVAVACRGSGKLLSNPIRKLIFHGGSVVLCMIVHIGWAVIGQTDERQTGISDNAWGNKDIRYWDG